MKILRRSLLPKRLQRRVALNFAALNIKPRLIFNFRKDLQRLTILSTITLFLLGYQPIVSFPPLKQVTASAQNIEAQSQEIQSATMPKLQLPHPGYLSTRFSRWHPGIDLATGLGMPIHPITEGIVEEVNFGDFGYGNDVVVSHPKGLKSLYGHMGRIYIKKGQAVTSQDILGTVGLTGFTSGPHTHLEILKAGVNIDPLTILPPIQDYPSEEYLKPVGEIEDKKLTKSLKPDFK